MTMEAGDELWEDEDGTDNINYYKIITNLIIRKKQKKLPLSGYNLTYQVVLSVATLMLQHVLVFAVVEMNIISGVLCLYFEEQPWIFAQHWIKSIFIGVLQMNLFSAGEGITGEFLLSDYTFVLNLLRSCN